MRAVERWLLLGIAALAVAALAVAALAVADTGTTGSVVGDDAAVGAVERRGGDFLQSLGIWTKQQDQKMMRRRRRKATASRSA